MPKDEIIRRAKWTCKHRHNGIDHAKCYEAVNPGERIGFLDIEASHLKGDFGFVISYCIKKHGGDILQRVLTPKDIRGQHFGKERNLGPDKRLCEQFLEDLNEFDRLVTYYGSGFDIPFLRTRCLTHGLDFPPMGTLFHTDLYFTVRAKLSLHRKKLQVACDQLGIPSKGHPLLPPVWMAAAAGDPAALQFILTHNIEDVVSTEALFDRLQGHYRLNKTSA